MAYTLMSNKRYTPSMLRDEFPCKWALLVDCDLTESLELIEGSLVLVGDMSSRFDEELKFRKNNPGVYYIIEFTTPEVMAQTLTDTLHTERLGLFL